MYIKQSPNLKTILDNFAPFGCGLGMISTPLYAILVHPHGPDWLIGMSPVLSYLLCTCTHRKYLLFSSVAFVGTIGGGFGFFLGAIISLPFQMTGAPDSGWILGGIFGFIFAVIISRIMCRREQRNEWEQYYRLYYYWYGRPPPNQYSQIRSTPPKYSQPAQPLYPPQSAPADTSKNDMSTHDSKQNH
jgi:hypothetical protein